MTQHFLKCFKTSSSAVLSSAEWGWGEFHQNSNSTLLIVGQHPCWGCSSRLGSAECPCKVEKLMIDELMSAWRWPLCCPLQRSPLRPAAPRVVPGAAPGEEPGPAGPCQPLPQCWHPWLAAGLCQGSCQVRFCLCFCLFATKNWISVTWQ